MKKVFSSYNIFLLVTIFVAIFPVLPTFGRSLVVGVWAVAVITLAISGIKKRKRKSLIVLIFFISVYIFYAISLFYSSDKGGAADHLFRRLPLLLFPILFYFSSEIINKKDKTKVLNIYSYSLLIFVGGVVVYLLSTGVVAEIKALANATVFIRRQMEEYTWLHPAYLSLFLGFAFINIMLKLCDCYKHITIIKRILFIALLFYVFIVMMLLSSKMSIMALGFVASLILILRSKNRKKVIVFIAAVILFCVVVISSLPNTRYRFGNMITALLTTQQNQNNPDSVRKGIYGSAFKIIGNNFIFGVGLGDVDVELQKQYAIDGHDKALEDKFNSHNQYIEIWLSSGIIPLLCFLFSLIVGVILSSIHKDYNYLAFILLSALALLTENILSRQAGVLFFAFFNSFFAFNYIGRKSVYINARFLTQKQSGVQRFAYEICNELSKDNDVELISPRGINSDYNLLGLRYKILSPLKSHFWEQISLPFYLSLQNNPLLLNLCNTAPLLYRNKVVTVHDLAFEHNGSWFSTNMVCFYRFLIPRICKNSKQIFTVSEFSKSELIKYYGIAKEKIEVVYNALPSVFSNKEVEGGLLEYGNYILTVGSIEPRKNMNAIVKAFELLDNKKLNLVIAGGFNKKVFSEFGILELVDDRIKFVESPNDEELALLYQNALAFVYVPHYEGFGIPVLEAMHFGCPCIISDIEVFREVYGDEAIYVNKDNVEEIASVIGEVLNKDKFNSRDSVISSELRRYAYSESAVRINEKLKSV